MDPVRLQTGEQVLCISRIDSDVCRRVGGERDDDDGGGGGGFGESGVDCCEFALAEGQETTMRDVKISSKNKFKKINKNKSRFNYRRGCFCRFSLSANRPAPTI